MLRQHLVPFLLAFLLSPVTALSQAPPSAAEFLGARGIAFTTPGLEKALAHPDPDVRSVVAGMLAERRSLEAIPFLETAWKREAVPHVRDAMGTALAELRSHERDASLIGICTNDRAAPIDRLTAANQLLSLSNPACTAAVIAQLSPADSSYTQQLTLEYLRKITHVPPAQLAPLRTYLYRELLDPLAINRQYASECLSLFGDQASTHILEQAIEAEHDPQTKTKLIENLKRLKARNS